MELSKGHARHHTAIAAPASGALCIAGANVEARLAPCGAGRDRQPGSARTAGYTESSMPIYRILQNVGFDPSLDPLVLAYERILRALPLGRSDPLTNDIAKTLFSLAQQGERDADRLLERTVSELGLSLPEARLEIGRKSADQKVRTLLIVDDDEAFAYAASRYFQGLGFEAIVADGSISAFRELERKSIDVMIADVRLGSGEPHGISLGRMVRNVKREMPVLLVTAYPELLEREKPLPGPSFVKPVDLKLLASAVRASLA